LIPGAVVPATDAPATEEAPAAEPGAEPVVEGEADLIGAVGSDPAESVQDQGGEPGGESEWVFEGTPEDGYTELEQVEGVTYAPEAVQHFTEFISNLNGGKGLSQTDLQSIFAYESERMLEAGTLQQTQLAQLNEGWASEIRNDPKLGGENLKASNRIVLMVFSGEKALPHAPEALAEMRKLGIQRNPHLFRLFHTVGEMIAEDGDFTVDGEAGEGGATTPNLKKTYPSMKDMIIS
jgi:hypothetical protein